MIRNIIPTRVARARHQHEVLARYDRDGKFEAYKKLPSFEQYVLLAQSERRIEVRTRHEQKWTTEVACGGEAIRIHGRDVAVDAIYG